MADTHARTHACPHTCTRSTTTHLHKNTHQEVAVIKVLYHASIQPLLGISAALLSLSFSNVSKEGLNCKMKLVFIKQPTATFFQHFPAHFPNNCSPTIRKTAKLFLVPFCQSQYLSWCTCVHTQRNTNMVVCTLKHLIYDFDECCTTFHFR